MAGPPEPLPPRTTDEDGEADAVFSDGQNSVDLEVFCNRVRPTLAELERNTLGD